MKEILKRIDYISQRNKEKQIEIEKTIKQYPNSTSIIFLEILSVENEIMELLKELIIK